MELIQTFSTPFGLILFFEVLFWDIIAHYFFSDVQSIIRTLSALVSTKWKIWNSRPIMNKQYSFCFHEDNIDEKICSAELKIVMDKLGIERDPDGDLIGAKELSELFEEEPSFEEVREAFDVFDENEDGFIDATELQRVLCNLGLEEVSQVEACKRMISAFDENGDGFIDLNEFVKFMEKCFC
ncbi:unnamed protein product [Camellia sinensis]